MAEVRNAKCFIEDVMYDDYFAEKCADWYSGDVCLILSHSELDELHKALNEWVRDNNIVKVNTVAGINNQIRLYEQCPEEEEE